MLIVQLTITVPTPGSVHLMPVLYEMQRSHHPPTHSKLSHVGIATRTFAYQLADKIDDVLRGVTPMEPRFPETQRQE